MVISSISSPKSEWRFWNPKKEQFQDFPEVAGDMANKYQEQMDCKKFLLE